MRQYTLDAYKRAIVQRKLEEVVLGDGLPEGVKFPLACRVCGWLHDADGPATTAE